MQQTFVDHGIRQGVEAQLNLAHLTVADLVHLRLFAGVGAEVLEGLLEAGEVRELATNEVLIRAGSQNTVLYLILSGRLRVHLEAPDGEVAGMLEAGESVGEMSLIDQRPASAHVVADAQTRVLAVPQEFFWMLVETSHAVARNLLVCLSQRLRHTDALVVRNLGMHKHYLRQTTMDELTGLHNRRWLENALERQVSRSRMSDRPLSLLLFDIDRFDRYNRAFGNEAGDAVLYAVARTLENGVRPTDLIARYGADGFAVVLPEATVEQARNVAARLQADIAEAVITMNDESTLPPVTASCGVAALRVGGGAEGLIADAGAALRDARHAGTNKMRG